MLRMHAGFAHDNGFGIARWFREKQRWRTRSDGRAVKFERGPKREPVQPGWCYCDDEDSWQLHAWQHGQHDEWNPDTWRPGSWEQLDQAELAGQGHSWQDGSWQ